MALSKEEIFKKAPSQEETTYTTAVELMDAVDCVERFEQSIFSLRSAAKKFEQLGDYKESNKLRQECIAKANKLEKEGCEETLQKAEKMYQEAKTNSGFIAASSEYRRLKKFDDYKERGIEGQKLCQKGIRKIETQKVYKRWCILFVTLAVIAVVVIQTPLIFLVKGAVHQVQKDYHAAIRCYKHVDSIPGVGRLERSCYYKIAVNYDNNEHHRKAMQTYRKAGGYLDADARGTRYQKRFIRKAEEGETVYFAGMRWILLDKEYLQERALLVKRTALEDDALSGEELDTEEVEDYLNNDYFEGTFSVMEQLMLTKELFVLSDSVYQSYEDVLPGGWDSKGIHPAVWISYQ